MGQSFNREKVMESHKNERVYLDQNLRPEIIEGELRPRRSNRKQVKNKKYNTIFGWALIICGLVLCACSQWVLGGTAMFFGFISLCD